MDNQKKRTEVKVIKKVVSQVKKPITVTNDNNSKFVDYDEVNVNKNIKITNNMESNKKQNEMNDQEKESVSTNGNVKTVIKKTIVKQPIKKIISTSINTKKINENNENNEEKEINERNDENKENGGNDENNENNNNQNDDNDNMNNHNKHDKKINTENINLNEIEDDTYEEESEETNDKTLKNDKNQNDKNYKNYIDKNDKNDKNNKNDVNKFEDKTSEIMKLVSENKSIEEIAQMMKMTVSQVKLKLKLGYFSVDSNDKKDKNVQKILDEHAFKTNEKQRNDQIEREEILKPFNESKFLKNITILNYLKENMNDDIRLQQLYEIINNETKYEAKRMARLYGCSP